MRPARALRACTLAVMLVAASPVYALVQIGFDDFSKNFTQLDLGSVRLSVSPAFGGTYGSGNYTWPDYEHVSGPALELLPAGAFGTTLTMDFKTPVSFLQFDLAAVAQDLDEDVIVLTCSGAGGSGSCRELTPPDFTGSGKEHQYFYSGSAIGSATVSYSLGFSAAGFSNVDSPLALDNLAFQLTSNPGGGEGAVPEPATYAMLAAGLLVLAGLSNHRRS